MNRWLGLLTLLGVASAQDLTAYKQLSAALDKAEYSSQKPPEALAHLQSAAAAYEKLKPSISDPQAATELQKALSQSKSAANRTPADLQAQLLLSKGTMRRILFAQSANAQNLSDPARMNVLADAFGLVGQERTDFLQDAAQGQLPRVQWRLQRMAALKVQAALAATQPKSNVANYLNLTRATSWFPLLPTNAAQPLKMEQFSEALRQLSAGETVELTKSLQTLGGGVTGYLASVKTLPAAVAPQPQPPATPTPAPPPTDNRAQAYAALGRALAKVSQGDTVQARAELAKVNPALQQASGEWGDSAGLADLMAKVSAAQTRQGLRPSDVQALITGLGALEDSPAGAGLLPRLSLLTTSVLSGGLRALLFLLLAIFGLVPLYLMDLSFGGRNTYWRAIFRAFALLLLPLLLEGFFGFLAWIGDVLGVSALRSLGVLSLFQGPYTLAVWLLLMAGAVGLSAYGFRGLSQQFGLLSRKTPSVGLSSRKARDWDEEL